MEKRSLSRWFIICLLCANTVAGLLTSQWPASAEEKHLTIPARLLGVSNYVMLVNNNYPWKQHIDLLHENGLNFCRFFALHQRAKTQYGGGELPWIRLPNGKYDLTKLNPVFFIKLNEILAYAQKKNITCMISLLDECGFEEDLADRPRWQVNPFRANNNINNVGPYKKNGIRFFHSDHFMDLCKPYIKKFIETVKKYPCVIIEICNEPTAGYAWEEKILSFIRSYGFSGLCCSSEEGLTDFYSIHYHSLSIKNLSAHTIVSNDGYEISAHRGTIMAQRTFDAGGIGFEFWDRKLNMTYDLERRKKTFHEFGKLVYQGKK